MKIQAFCKKVCIALLVYHCLLILQACCNGCAPPDRPYFDYDAIIVNVNHPHPLAVDPDGYFGFSLLYDNIEYVASTNYSQGLINSAHACSCETAGDRGAKYNFKQINFYTDSIFDASIPNEESLSSLFEVLTSWNPETRQYETIPLEEVHNFPFRLYPSQEIRIRSKAKPVAYDRPYYFEIEVVKTNGDIITSTVGPITWTH